MLITSILYFYFVLLVHGVVANNPMNLRKAHEELWLQLAEEVDFWTVDQ